MSWFQMIASTRTPVTTTEDLQAYINANRIVLFGEGTYTVTTTLTIPNGTILVGIPGKTIISCPTVNGINLTAPQDVTIFGINFTSSGTLGAVTTYAEVKDRTNIGTISGVKVSGIPLRCRIETCNFKGFTRAGFEIVDAQTFEDGFKMNSCNFSYNYIGLWIGERAEYSQYANISAAYNKIGVIVEAGNTTLTGIHADKNSVGMAVSGYLVANDSHGTCGNSTFNHNTLYGVVGIEFTVGFTFTGCHMWDSALYINNSIGFSWVGGALVGRADFIGTAGKHLISSTMFRLGSYSSGTIVGTTVNLKDNFYMGGESSTALNN